MIKTANKPVDYTTEKLSANVVRVNIPYQKNDEWEWWCLLRSDAHHDNPHSLHDVEKRHLDQVVKRRAGIVDAGDLFCAMQGKYDRRASKDNIRPENQVDNYLDSLVETAADFYQPYAHHFISIGQGNHETAIRRIHETDLTERLISRLNDRTGSNISNGWYSGYVKFCFRTQHKNSNGNGQTIELYYHHGAGGGGPVTKGVIQHNRRATFIRSDIIQTGHIHERWCVPIQVIECSQNGQVKHKTQYHIQCPTYKDEYGDGRGGYHVENHRPPKPIGAWWVRFYFNTLKKEIEIEPIEAK